LKIAAVVNEVRGKSGKYIDVFSGPSRDQLLHRFLTGLAELLPIIDFRGPRESQRLAYLLALTHEYLHDTDHVEL